jgi:hypothetical protein
MPGFIKTSADERMWDTAKDRARAAATKGGVYNVWGLANSIFHKMKSGEMVNEESITPELENGTGLINNILEEDCWKDIKHYVFNHPVYSELSEEELYEKVESCYESYLKQNKDLSTGVIYEFVNQYMNGGSGMSTGGYLSSGGVLGGWRDERPIGPVVYGMPGNTMNTPYDPNKPEPAVVEIPDKKSNYQPWAFELDNDGDVKNDIERNKTMADDEKKSQVWEQTADEIGSHLENSGVDLDSLEDMTQEEIEDTLIKVVKSEAAKSNNSAAKAAVSKLSENILKIQEAFAWEAMSEDRVDGKTRRAREILAKKHQIKKALERDVSKRFVMDKKTIEKTMFKYGYMFDKNGWAKKPPKADKTLAPVASAGAKPDVDANKQINVVAPNQPNVKDVQPDAPVQQQPNAAIDDVDNEDSEDEDPNPLHDAALRNEMKALEARFILGLGHGDKDAADFVKNEETDEEVPKIPDEDILKKFELLGYRWNPDKLLWAGENMSLPQQLFAKNETLKTVFARAYLAARGKLNSIKMNASGEPSVSIDSIVEEIMDDGFTFNADTNSWAWSEKLQESIQPEAPGFLPAEEEDADIIDEAQKKQDPQKLGYDPIEISHLQARFLLRAEYLNQFATWLKKKNHAPLAIEAAWAKVQDPQNNPVNFNKNNLNGPSMSDPHVIKDLENLGYKDDSSDGLPIWTKNGNIPNYIGESKESIMARAIISAQKNKSDFIGFDDADAKTGKIGPSFSSKRILNAIQSLNFSWDDENGWVKAGNAPASNLSKDQLAYKQRAKKVINQYIIADWKHMTSAEKDAYEEYSAYPELLRYFGIDEKDWPAGNSQEEVGKRKSALKKFKKVFKLENNDKGEKIWIRRKKPVEGELNTSKFKSAVGSVARKLGTLGKFAGLAGGGLISALIGLNRMFDPGVQKTDPIADLGNKVDKLKQQFNDKPKR